MITIEDFKKKQTNKVRLLGLDLGSKRIGLSISDENQTIATPHKTLIKSTKSLNHNVYAVGTTATRALENYASKSYEGDFSGEADLYITPGYKFKIIDGLITNFHLPQSTLLLLVASIIGRDKLLELYDIAIKNNYRFYSYGDSMFIKA